MTWYRDLRLRWKLLGAFGLVLLLSTALSVLAYLGVVQNDEAATLVDDTRTALSVADEALIGLVDMETGLRGFLLTGREDFLEPYSTGLLQYRQRLDELQGLTADRPAAARRWGEIEAQARSWVQDYAEVAVRLRREVNAGTRPLEDVTSLATSGAGKVRFDAVRQGFARATAEEESLLAQRNAQLRDANDRLKAVLLAGTALLVCLGLLIAVLLANDLAAVAGRLEAAAGHIAAGDLSHRIGLRRRDELGVTAVAFDHMAAQLAGVEADREQAAAALRTANAELEQFAYTVSHDLKAPLVTIQGFAHRLMKDHSAQLDAAAQRYLTRIEVNATHLGDLIEDVLAFSRVGRVGAPPETVDLEAAVRRALDGLQATAEAGGARLKVAGPLPEVVASTTLVNQILTNLIVNALTYGALPGGVPQVEVGCEDRGDSWRLYVRDSGPGIPGEQQDRLFRLFERLPAGKSANPEGTGVGLATVRKAAQAMGGSAGVVSAAGAGATFWVQFPKVAAGLASVPGGTLDPELPAPDRAAALLARP